MALVSRAESLCAGFVLLTRSTALGFGGTFGAVFWHVSCQTILENIIVLGFLSAMVLWTCVGLPLIHSWDDLAHQGDTMQFTNWMVLLVGLLGGSLTTFIVKTLIDQWNRHIISARLVVDGRGCYVTTWRGNPPTHRAQFLRLLIENKGCSSIKNCQGYVTAITRIVNGHRLPVEQEVLELNWSAGGGIRSRSIPRGAFFYLDVASLDLLSEGHNILGFGVAYWPNHFTELLATAATFELAIKIAADNAAPFDRIVRFDFNPQHQDLGFVYD